MADNRTDRPYWCEICARKKECYGITLKPKCFVPIADRKTEPIDKDINVRSKTEPQPEEPPMDEYYKDHDEFYDCDRYVVTNDEGERAYNCIGCERTDCSWK